MIISTVDRVCFVASGAEGGYASKEDGRSALAIPLWAYRYVPWYAFLRDHQDTGKTGISSS
jgi:hypothetical protein